MPERKLPRHIRDYLGPCREAETPVEMVFEQCHLAKFMEDGTLSDYDPLIVVMHLVAEEVRGLRLSPNGPKGGQVWIDALTELQNDMELEHNNCIPCRYCDQAFQPIIDKKLLKLYLAWEQSRSTADFLAIHRCADCRGKILPAKPTHTYDGDWHTPEPIWRGSDEEWVDQLLMQSGLRYA